MPGASGGTLDGLSGGSISAQSGATAIGVFTWNGASALTLLPNVVCERIDCHEGPNPPTARFRYLLDDTYRLIYGYPSRFEQLWPIDAQGPYVVSADERVIVAMLNPDGSVAILFDGFGQIPEFESRGDSEGIHFTAVGIAQRCFDAPISGSTWRDAGQITTTDGSADWSVAMPPRFNPASDAPGSRGGVIGNATALACFTVPGSGPGAPPGSYPVFLDPLLNETQPASLAQWDVPGALLYLLSVEAPEQTWVTWPSFATLGTLLASYYPPSGSQSLTAGSAQQLDLTVRDLNGANRTLPDLLAELLGYAGILMCWQVATNAQGNPQTYLKLYRRDQFATQTAKLLYLATEGGAVDPSTTNVAGLHLARDSNQIVNQWQVESGEDEVEITVYLAPLFRVASGDETAGVNAPTPTGRNQFFRSNFGPATPPAILRAYRWFGADECGDGHWNALSSAWVTGKPCDMSPAFPPAGTPLTRQYVQRYRPGSHRLLSRDSAGRPIEAILEVNTSAVSIDPFVGAIPWAGGGTWRRVAGGWRLLRDRLGIEVTVEDPDNWSAGKAVGDIRTVGWLQSGSSSTFALRLTTTVKADTGTAGVTAARRPASPTQFARQRNADARDHLRQGLITVGSLNYPNQLDVNGNPGDGTHPLLTRDDTTVARGHAAALRSAHEFPPLAGSVVLPYVTTYYQVGDLVQQVRGRGATLQTNVGAGSGETPCYAWVVGVSWSFTGNRQETILQLSDRRAEVRNVHW